MKNEENKSSIGKLKQDNTKLEKKPDIKALLAKIKAAQTKEQTLSKEEDEE